MDYILFLEGIINDIKSNNISERENELLKKFYMEYNLKNILKSEDDNEGDENTRMIKFLIYGWYLNSLVK
jgi:hypothetical protein